MAKFDSKEILNNFKMYSEDATSKVKSSADNAKNIAGRVVQKVSKTAEKAVENTGKTIDNCHR